MSGSIPALAQSGVKWALGRVPWAVRRIAGTDTLATSVNDLRRNVHAIADTLVIVVASVSRGWSSDQLERVMRLMANFPSLEHGLGTLKPGTNPVSQEEVDRLKAYTARAKAGGRFTSQEATDFKTLAERVAKEHASEEWVKDLLQLASFLFAVYVVGPGIEEQRVP